MDSIDQIRNNIVEVDMLLDYASNNTEDIKRYQMFIKASVVLLSTKFEVFLEEFIDEHSRLVLAGHTNATISTELKNKYNEILSAENNFNKTFKKNEIIYENITAYFVFRYFLGAVYDKDIFSTLMFAYFSVKIIKMCDILKWLENKNNLSNNDRIMNMKLYSKEIEYSTENMDSIRDFLWDKFYI